jgi:hypothetical protein
VTKEDLPEIGRGDFGANSRGEEARKEETKTISLADLRAIKRFLNSAGLITVEGKAPSGGGGGQWMGWVSWSPPPLRGGGLINRRWWRRMKCFSLFLFRCWGSREG